MLRIKLCGTPAEDLPNGLSTHVCNTFFEHCMLFPSARSAEYLRCLPNTAFFVPCSLWKSGASVARPGAAYTLTSCSLMRSSLGPTPSIGLRLAR